MKNGNAPGPDGFTLSYYKMFAVILAPRFVSAYISLTEGYNLPDVSILAHVTVIPEEGKDPAHCISDRSILLLNVDLNIFTKIIANRLVPHIPSLVHIDQSRFVPGREGRDNTQRVLNTIHYAQFSHSPLVLLFTDAEKAFHRVDWLFPSTTLENIGLGPETPSARVKVNEVLSTPFKYEMECAKAARFHLYIYAYLELSLESRQSAFRISRVSRLEVASMHWPLMQMI